jgi:hypothetical protein
MKTVAVSPSVPAGFDTRRIVSLRWRSRVKRAIKIGMLCIPLGIVVYLGADYLARTPRERKLARLSYVERVLYGARFNAIFAWNWLTARQDDPKESALPVMELYIRKERLKALEAHLPESGKFHQPGLFKVRKKGEPNSVAGATMRFRGDSMNHWAFPQKSWRVKLKRKARYSGMRQFNLYLPRSQSQIPDFLGYAIAHEMGGLVVPTAYPVHLRINRQFAGMRVFLEQVNEEFFSTHQIAADRLFIGDIDYRDVYQYEVREQLFKELTGWEVLPVQKGGDSSKEPLKALIEALPLATTDTAAFKASVERVLDVSSTLRYMAYLEIVGSVHADETHNQRYYFDSTSRKLRPIVWDPVAYYRDEIEGIDFAPNGLFKALLQIPEYREEKNRFIWEAITGNVSADRVQSMISESADRIRPEIEASPQKVYTFRSNLDILPNGEWNDAVDELVRKSRARTEVLQNALTKTSVAIESVKGPKWEEVKVSVGGDAGFRATRLVFDCAQGGSQSVVLEMDGEGKKLACTPTDGDACVVDVSLPMWSVRRVDKNDDLVRQSGVYLWRVRSSSTTMRLRAVHGANSITGELRTVEVKRR